MNRESDKGSEGGERSDQSLEIGVRDDASGG